MNSTRLGLMIILLALSLTGCARSKPIVDRRGLDPAAYAQDLAECQSYAEQVETEAQVVGGAAGGAAVGGAMGAILNGAEGAAKGAGVGAVGGAAGGVRRSVREQDQVVKNCLRGRGYRVLN